MSRHDKFIKYWESIGKPNLEWKYPERTVWNRFDGPSWPNNYDYRIAGDPHWELRRKWIDSDFTLPIEEKTIGGWMSAAIPFNFAEYEYREAKPESLNTPQPCQVENIDATLSERGKRYGPFQGHAHVTQEIKKAMQRHSGWKNLNSSQVEALEMIAHKIGRIINGDPNYDDSWRDIAGYSTLIVKQLAGEDG